MSMKKLRSMVKKKVVVTGGVGLCGVTGGGDGSGGGTGRDRRSGERRVADN